MRLGFGDNGDGVGDGARVGDEARFGGGDGIGFGDGVSWECRKSWRPQLENMKLVLMELELDLGIRCRLEIGTIGEGRVGDGVGFGGVGVEGKPAIPIWARRAESKNKEKLTAQNHHVPA